MTAAAEPLVSIVTPFYNTRQYLSECIESVLAQTYHNFEYLLVNNCSTDGSADIARQYADRDPRVRLIHADTFRNQTQNYNYALTHISDKSAYCKIVQADDWILPQCIGLMVSVAQRRDSIGLVSGYNLLGSNVTARVANTGLPYRADGWFAGSDVCRMQILEGHHFFGSPTSVMFHSDVVRSRTPFYQELMFEDTAACLEILKDWDFGFVFQVIAYQRTENESFMSRIRRLDPYMMLEKMEVVSIGARPHLNDDEYRAAVADRKGRYFRFLARNAILGRDGDFWDYHKQGLARLGIQVSRRTLCRYVIWQLVDKLLNPKRTVEQLIAQRKRKDR